MNKLYNAVCSLFFQPIRKTACGKKKILNNTVLLMKQGFSFSQRLIRSARSGSARTAERRTRTLSAGNAERPGRQTIPVCAGHGNLTGRSIKTIQVSYLMPSQAAIDREFGAFAPITDASPKYVLSLDKVDMSRNGIAHMNIPDFLLHRQSLALT